MFIDMPSYKFREIFVTFQSYDNSNSAKWFAKPLTRHLLLVTIKSTLFPVFFPDILQ